MNIEKVYAVYFSPTGGTKKIVTMIAKETAKRLGSDFIEIDYTSAENRKNKYNFGKNDFVVIGTPVYAGRIPNKILPDLEAGIFGSGDTKAAAVSVYGNRNYDEALRELILLSEKNGFSPIAAAAVVNRHVFSEILAAGRPDDTDIREIREFADKIAVKLGKFSCAAPVAADRESEIGSYYTPLKVDGMAAKFLHAKPITDMKKCDSCGICADLCPMESISRKNTSEVNGICIKCHACIKKCPNGAKYFDNSDFLSHVKMLEENYTIRKNNLFIL
ncbi:MAG: 4Fe-4S binding protein [Firmicutes bacterium]|nr:4Fe-4S binding protein [Bacillota bacterium]